MICEIKTAGLESIERLNFGPLSPQVFFFSRNLIKAGTSKILKYSGNNTLKSLLDGAWNKPHKFANLTVQKNCDENLKTWCDFVTENLLVMKYLFALGDAFHIHKIVNGLQL